MSRQPSQTSITLYPTERIMSITSQCSYIPNQNNFEDFNSKFTFIDLWARDQQRRHAKDIVARHQKIVFRPPAPHPRRQSTHGRLLENRIERTNKVSENSKQKDTQKSNKFETDPDFQEKEIVFLYRTKLGVNVYGEVS
ncbi:unnamed protein product, partial [Mesorhabditis belari]|uniref:Uncharacterized protein n=1 Tax=Mesorhabditis belari TaxID=2138241 RepID=A0AAF3EVC2_9BILA